jgi:1-aminocyclopropane-1-carboxylate deaminase/D-cysteine desulfhydrase-like pyridoxal-dependent ACC family enzyme
LPTPFHKLENLSKKYGAEIYIKRDDLTGPSVYGGNKTRKLEFILGRALQEGVKYLISVGGYQTNSGMEMTTFCRICNLKPILFLLDVKRQGEPKEFRANLLLNKIMDCELHYVKREPGERTNICIQLAEKRKEELDKEGLKAMVLPGGVSVPEGWISYVVGFQEIYDQSERMNMELDYLFHTTGTGGTLPGLLAGKFLLGSNTKIVSIYIGHVASGEYSSYEDMIRDRVERIFKQFDIKPVSRNEILREINVDKNFLGEEYATPTREGNDAIKELAKEEGLMLDPVYTGKGFAGFLHYIKSGIIPKGSKVAFLHTGGTIALFAEPEITGKLYD